MKKSMTNFHTNGKLNYFQQLGHVSQTETKTALSIRKIYNLSK